MKKIIIALIMMLNAFNISAQSKDSIIIVRYGIFIKQMVPNFKEGKFHAEFYWWAIFQNDTANKNNPTNDDILKLSYVNGIGCTANDFKNEIEEEQHWTNNTHYYTGFHQGDFYFEPDFSMYPLDVQKMEIQIEHALLPDSKLLIFSDTSSYLTSKQDKHLYGLSKNILNQKNAVYRILKTDIAVVKGEYNSNFGDPKFEPMSIYSRLKVMVFIDRSFLPYIAKLIIPLMIILLLVYLVFYLPAEKIDIAAGLTVTSLLSAIAFQLSISGEIPEIGYIIYIDKIFYTCYFLIALSMVQSIITFYMDKTGVPKLVRTAIRLDIIFRFLFPFLFFISLYIFAR